MARGQEFLELVSAYAASSQVTSTHVSHTYPDGSCAVPCAVMAY